MIIAELDPRTSDKKHTPNCSNCDNQAYFKFKFIVGYQWVSDRDLPFGFNWRKCANCMTDEEREAVRCLVLTLGNMAL